MSDNREVASSLLKEAHDTISKKRPGVHGSAEQSFTMIGELWTLYLRHARRVRGNDIIQPKDVAQLMSMLKKARAMYGDINNADNFVDDAGYTALAGMLQLPDPAEVAVKAASDAVITHKHTGINTPAETTELDTRTAAEILGEIYGG